MRRIGASESFSCADKSVGSGGQEPLVTSNAPATLPFDVVGEERVVEWETEGS